MLHWGLGRRFARWGPSGSSAAQTMADALIAAMTPAPDATRQALIRSTFDIAAPALPKLDTLFVTAAHATGQPALINWVNPAFAPLVAANSPAFVVDRGYTGDGTTSGLTTSGVNVTSMTNFKQDAASVFAWSRTDGTGAGGDFGTAGGTNTFAIIRNAGSSWLSRINSGTGITVANASAIGFFGVSRNNAADCQYYKNGAPFGTAAAVSAAPTAATFSLCRGSSTFSIRQIAAGGCGGALDDSQWLALYNALAAYMTAVGA